MGRREEGNVQFATSRYVQVPIAQSKLSLTGQANKQSGSITELLRLCPLPLLPLERWFLGAAAAPAPPVAAAQAPFSCSSPLLLVRLLFFPLLFFWLGILHDSDVSVFSRPHSTAAVDADWHFCGLHVGIVSPSCCCFGGLGEVARGVMSLWQHQL